MTPLTPTDLELFPFFGLDDTCEYCGAPQTDAEAEHRTVDHITRDLVAINHQSSVLLDKYGILHPGYDDNLYDLKAELAAAGTATGPQAA